MSYLSLVRKIEATSEKTPNPNRVCSGCRWYPRLKVYKGDHFWFDPAQQLATSYHWYPMLMKIGNRLVLNDCRYSNQTAKDFGRLWSCLRREGLKPDCSIYAPLGLHNLGDSLAWYLNRIQRLREEIATPRSHRRKNVERKLEIRRLGRKVALVKSLMRAAKAQERRVQSQIKFA